MEITQTPAAGLTCALDPGEQFLHVVGGRQKLGGERGLPVRARVTTLVVRASVFDLAGHDISSNEPLVFPELADPGVLPPYHRQRVAKLQAWLRAGGNVKAIA